jgi:hypothetical protein
MPNPTINWYSNELRAGRPGLDSRQGHDVSLLRRVQTGSVAHPTSYPMGTGGSFRGDKRPWPEADYLFALSAEVKNCEPVPPLLHILSWHNA